MKMALVLAEVGAQIVLSPENDAEKAILKLLQEFENYDLRFVRADFMRTIGEYYRIDQNESRDLIMVLKPPHHKGRAEGPNDN